MKAEKFSIGLVQMSATADAGENLRKAVDRIEAFVKALDRGQPVAAR